jgi:hypothetical protein
MAVGGGCISIVGGRAGLISTTTDAFQQWRLES